MQHSILVSPLSRLGNSPGISFASALAQVNTILVLLIVSTCFMSTAAMAATYAILIGVGDYPQLPAMLRLKGPSNDVSALKMVLIEKGVPGDNIRTLLDREATLSNIQTAIHRLAREVDREDVVILYFSGHGSQTPVQVLGGRSNEEPDHLDEIFLPADIGAWDGRRGKVRNALSDDDLNNLVSGIRRRGAFVWAIFDICHAAGSTREITNVVPDDGEPAYQVRAVSPQTLGVPEKHLNSQVRSALSRDVRLGASDPGPGAGGLVAYYASDSNGKARERAFSDGVGRQRHFGVFTHALVKALRTTSNLPSYQALMHQVAAITREESGQPSSLLEGAAYLTQPVLSPVPLPPPPVSVVPNLRLAPDPKAGDSVKNHLARLSQHDFQEDGFNLSSVPTEQANTWIRTCPDGQHYLSAAKGDVCSNPEAQALRLTRTLRMDKALRTDLCRLAVGAHLLELTATQVKGKNTTKVPLQVSFEFRRKDTPGWSLLSSGNFKPDSLNDGDVVRPRVRIPANHSLEYSLFFIDAKGRAWPFTDSRASPPVHSDLAGQELELRGLRIETGAESTLGLERAVLILSGRHLNTPKGSWSVMPSCQQEGPAMIYPSNPNAVAMAIWETTPGHAHQPGK